LTVIYSYGFLCKFLGKTNYQFYLGMKIVQNRTSNHNLLGFQN